MHKLVGVSREEAGRLGLGQSKEDHIALLGITGFIPKETDRHLFGKEM